MLLILSDMSKVNTWAQAVPFGCAFTLTQITTGIFIDSSDNSDSFLRIDSLESFVKEP